MERLTVRELLGRRLLIRGQQLMQEESADAWQAAFRLIRAAAWTAFYPALMQAGICCEKGLGTKVDGRRAYRYYCRAARTGKPDARFLQAACLMRGLGTRQDLAAAARIFESLAQEGIHNAWINLGVCYMDGPEEIQNPEKAKECFGKAAAFGDVDALVNLGLWEMQMKQDQAAAYRHFTRAAEKGDAKGRYFQGVMLVNGQAVQQDVAAGIDLLTAAAEQHFPLAQAQLGVILLGRAQTDQERQQAVDYLEKATEESALARYHLGEYRRQKAETAEEKHHGMELIVSAAFHREPAAIRGLSRLQMNGVEFAPIRSDARENPFARQKRLLSRKRRVATVSTRDGWHHQPVDYQAFYVDAIEGDPYAQFVIGCAFYEGKLGQKDELAAAYWHTLAALQGDRSAQLNLAFLYWDGPETLRDDEVAAYWFERAAELGHPKAMYRLGNCLLWGRGRKRIRKPAFNGSARRRSWAMQRPRMLWAGCIMKGRLWRRIGSKPGHGWAWPPIRAILNQQILSTHI